MPEEFVTDIIAASEAEGAGDTLAEAAAEEQVSSDQLPDLPTEDKTPPAEDATDKTPGDLPEEAAGRPAESDPQSLSVEELATQLGWRADHQGEDKVDAATYILRSREIQDTMRDHNKDLKNQLSTVQSSIEALKVHNEKVYRADVRRMENEIAELKKQKRDAVELADVDKVDEIDQKIEGIQQDIKDNEVQETPSANPVYDEWVKDNDWYLTNDEMAAYADNVAQQYAGAPLERVYNLVRQRVAEVWPEKFEAPAKPELPADSVPPKEEKKDPPQGPPSPVESGSKRAPAATFTKADLTQDQLQIMRQFVGSGIMTEEQYISDIAKLQEG